MLKASYIEFKLACRNSFSFFRNEKIRTYNPGDLVIGRMLVDEDDCDRVYLLNDDEANDLFLPLTANYISDVFDNFDIITAKVVREEVVCNERF